MVRLESLRSLQHPVQWLNTRSQLYQASLSQLPCSRIIMWTESVCIVSQSFISRHGSFDNEGHHQHVKSMGSGNLHGQNRCLYVTRFVYVYLSLLQDIDPRERKIASTHSHIIMFFPDPKTLKTWEIYVDIFYISLGISCPRD